MTEELHDAVTEELRAHMERGDVDAGAKLLLQRYGDELGGYLAALAGSPDLAADAYGQLCEDLWRGLPGFAFRSSARTWLYTLARHALARVARDPQRKRDRNLPLSATEHLTLQQPLVRERTAAYRRTTMKDRVRALREQLAEGDQELLILRVDRALDWLDVARVLHDEEDPSLEDLKRFAASLRKRFERLRERLRALALAAGLLGDEPRPASR